MFLPIVPFTEHKSDQSIHSSFELNSVTWLFLVWWPNRSTMHMISYNLFNVYSRILIKKRHQHLTTEKNSHHLFDIPHASSLCSLRRMSHCSASQCLFISSSPPALDPGLLSLLWILPSFPPAPLPPGRRLAPSLYTLCWLLAAFVLSLYPYRNVAARTSTVPRKNKL